MLRVNEAARNSIGEVRLLVPMDGGVHSSSFFERYRTGLVPQTDVYAELVLNVIGLARQAWAAMSDWERRHGEPAARILLGQRAMRLAEWHQSASAFDAFPELASRLFHRIEMPPEITIPTYLVGWLDETICLPELT